ncbi:COP1-interactive protein 1-like [Tetranychus urticae]|uniref:Uncharacterized protein n=1 Tax=Tetranychus urticae TaxID=32264 RepID=T1KDR6_TETUR|nr:COP1-interactive protein 1-like [Tetranychus urticae]
MDMSGFSRDSSPNQQKRFSTGLKIFQSYAESSNEPNAYNQLVNFCQNGDFNEFQQVTPPMAENCSNCSIYLEQINSLHQENDLLTQLVGNLRNRIRDTQAVSTLSQKFANTTIGGEIARHQITNGEMVGTSPLTYKPKEFDARESKIIITRLTSELEFFKALNANTELCWLKKFEDAKADNLKITKNLEDALLMSQETICQLAKELENTNAEKQAAINKMSSELFCVQSAEHVKITALTKEFVDFKASKEGEIDDLKDTITDLNEKLDKSKDEISNLEKEIEELKSQHQKTIDELNQKLDQAEEEKKVNQNHTSNLLKELTMTRLNCQITMSKLTKEMEKEHNGIPE